MVIHICVFPRGGMMTGRHCSDILEPIVRPHEALLAMHSF